MENQLKKPFSGVYTKIKSSAKTVIDARVKVKGRTLRYIIEGIAYLSTTEYKSFLELIDKAHQRENDFRGVA